MSVRRRILVVGLDACDRQTALDLAAQGRMPVLQGLLSRGTRCPTRGPFGLFVGAIWPSFATGLKPDRHRLHGWDEIDIGSYERRLTSVSRLQGEPFWRRLGQSGRRVVAIDVPHAFVREAANSIEIGEWGCHDRHFGLSSWPPGEAASVERDFGPHPIFGADAHAVREFSPDDYVLRAGPLRTAEEDRSLIDGLLAGVGTKARLSARFLQTSDWDLLVTVFGESHAVGHQQWHLHDESHPRFDSARRAFVGGDPVARVYSALDAALGKLMALAGEETLVLVLLSHGMRAHHDGTHLLDELLRRIDLADRTAESGDRWGVTWKRALQALPPAWQRRVSLPLLRELRRRAAERSLPPSPEYVTPAERADQRFYAEPNNTVYGGVRFNRSGREPRGLVEAGASAALSARLAHDLQALVNVATGGPVICGVVPSDRWYRRRNDDTIPDLFIDWERSAPVETVWSPKTGLVHGPYRLWRTGDHRPEGLLLAVGPDVTPGAAMPEIAIEDLPVSLLARLGCAGSDLDGSPAGWLVG
jgi:predicted AlkP superfamily phosphohydrolase/phosphomutase